MKKMQALQRKPPRAPNQARLDKVKHTRLLPSPAFPSKLCSLTDTSSWLYLCRLQVSRARGTGRINASSARVKPSASSRPLLCLVSLFCPSVSSLLCLFCLVRLPSSLPSPLSCLFVSLFRLSSAHLSPLFCISLPSSAPRPRAAPDAPDMPLTAQGKREGSASEPDADRGKPSKRPKMAPKVETEDYHPLAPLSTAHPLLRLLPSRVRCLTPPYPCCDGRPTQTSSLRQRRRTRRRCSTASG